MSNAKHTPTPWMVGKYGGIFPASGGSAITLMYHKDGSPRANAKANSEFIVRACNAHDELLEALERLVCYFECPIFTDGRAEAVAKIRDAKAIAAKARGES